jgi:hypothetical protein
MKVSEAIKKLKKMPKDAEMAWRDHDQGIEELNAFLNRIELEDFNEIQPNMFDLKEEIVVLS